MQQCTDALMATSSSVIEPHSATSIVSDSSSLETISCSGTMDGNVQSGGDRIIEETQESKLASLPSLL